MTIQVFFANHKNYTKDGQQTWEEGLRRDIVSKNATLREDVVLDMYNKEAQRYKQQLNRFTSGKFEGSLKNRGLYEDYVKNLKGKNNLTILDEAQSYLLDAINTSNSQYVSEDGVIERWVGGLDKEKLTKELKQTIKETKAKIKSRLNDEKRT